MIINRAVTMISLGGGILAVLASIILGQYALALPASALFAFSLFIWKYGYLLVPHITRAANIVEVRGDYTIPPSRDCVIKKASGRYYATRFMEIMFYESTLDKDGGGKQSLFEAFEKTLGSLKHTIKISFLLSPIDLSKYVDEAKTRRSEAEARKAKLDPGSPDTTRLDREIAMWNRLLERLATGERPMEIVAFASTTASGVTRDEAISRAKRQAQEIKTILSSSLSAEVRDLEDLDMVRCLEWEYFIPEGRDELADEVF